MLQSRIFNISNMSFNIIHENRILTKFYDFTYLCLTPFVKKNITNSSILVRDLDKLNTLLKPCAYSLTSVKQCLIG